MKLTVIIYHKNIYSVYRREWVEKCLDSIRNQTYKEFRVFELCYSDAPEQLYEGSEYMHQPMANHIVAMNYMLDTAFAHGADVVANVNLDDIFNWNRFAIQMKAVEAGYDLVSSNFAHIDENDNLIRDMLFDKLDIKQELNNAHNPIAHPSCCYTKKFWEDYKYYDTEKLGNEDMLLWTKAANAGAKIFITPQILLYHRIHANQTGKIHAITPTT
jgi:hypothetical protein